MVSHPTRRPSRPKNPVHDCMTASRRASAPPPPFPPDHGDTPGANAHLIPLLISPPPPHNFIPRPIAHPLDPEIGHALYYGSLFPVIKHMHE